MRQFLDRVARDRASVFAAAAMGLAIYFLLMTSMVRAHDWYADHRYTDPSNPAIHCCSGDVHHGDCAAYPAESVQDTPDGYKLATGEVVPYAKAYPSQDRHFHRCKRYDGSTRCFFSPRGGV